MAEAQEITRPVTSGQPPFVSVEPASTDALRFEGHLPGFEAKDTNGKVWRSADLLGKLTVVDIWGSRGPNEEHKELQRFYEKVRNSEKIQVLTFCIDYDYTHAADYMKQKNYSFAVIADWELTRKLFGRPGNLSRNLRWPGWERDPMPEPDRRPWHFPQQWVINEDGRLSARFAHWTLNRILAEVEARAAAN